MTLNIIHRHMELTEAIKSYVEEKIETLAKYGNMIRHADVEVGKTNAHHKHGNVFLCKAVFALADGEVIRVDREANDLYKAIDKVRDHARQVLTNKNRQKADTVAV